MALAGTDRGTGGNTTSATSLAVVPASNFTPGALAVLCVGYDNSMTSPTAGGDPFVSIADDSGANVWTSRVASLNDPGAANAGCTLRIFTCYVWTLLTSHTITVSFGAVSVPSKAWTLMEVTAAAGSTPEFSTGAQTTGTSTNPTITSSSITSGNMIVGAIAAESNAAMTADSDSTNGNWSANQSGSAGNGTSAANIEIMSQRKVTTGTGTQTYNLALTSSDWCAGWVELVERAIPAPGSAVRARIAQ